MVKHLKDRNSVVSDREGDLNVDSDYEGDPIGVIAEAQEAEEKEGATRAVLITGLFSAYVRFIASC